MLDDDVLAVIDDKMVTRGHSYRLLFQVMLK